MATVKYTFNPFELADIDPPSGTENRRAAVREIADFVIEQVLSDVAASKSPIDNGRFVPLSKEYKKFKTKRGRPGKPNLEFSGDMLDALQSKVSGNKITIQITGKEGDKADGHNNHSGKSSLPTRRFIPTEDETFREGILAGVRNIVEAFDGS